LEGLWEDFRANPTDSAFAPLYEATKGVVYTICLRVLKQRDDAIEAMQSTYARLLAFAQGAAEDLQEEGFQDMVCRLAIREADRLRKRKVRRLQCEFTIEEIPVEASEAPSAVSVVALRQLQEKLRSIVKLLPEKERTPVELHYFEELTISEVAAALRRPISTVSRQIGRGLKQLEPLLRQAGLDRTWITALGLAGATELILPSPALSASFVFSRASVIESAKATAPEAAVDGFAGLFQGERAFSAKWAAPAAAIFALGAAIFGFRHSLFPDPPSPIVRGVGTVETAPSQVSDSIAPAILPDPIDSAVERAADGTAPPADAGAGAGAAAEPPPTEAPPKLAEIEAPPPVDPAKTAALSVRLRSASDGRPISGGRVTLSNMPSTTTDERGIVWFDGVPAGLVVVQADADDYATAFRQMMLEAETTPHRDIDLAPGGSIGGVVADAADAPLEGVLIYPADLLANPIEGLVGLTTRSSASGFFELSGVPLDTEISLRFRAEGYLPRIHEGIIVRSSSMKAFQNVTMEKAGAIVVTGKVVDLDGNPIAGATVEGLARAGGRIGEALTAADGAFSYVLVENSENLSGLAARAEGFSPSVRVVDPGTATSGAEYHFTLRRGRAQSGRIVDEAGEGLEGIPIAPMVAGDLLLNRYLLRIAARSADDGVFGFDDLPADAVLSVEPAAPYAPTRVRLSADGADLEIPIARMASLEGRVIDDSTERPITDFTIRISSNPLESSVSTLMSDAWARWNSGAAISAKDDGTFALNGLSPGHSFTLSIDANGFMQRDIRIDWDDVANGYPDQTVRLTAGEGLTIRGTVRDSEGKALSGVEVIYQFRKVDPKRPGNNRSGVARNAPRSNTDAEGQFVIANAPPDHEVIVSIGHPDYVAHQQTIESTQLAAEESIAIELTSGARLWGRFDRARFPEVSFLSLHRPNGRAAEFTLRPDSRDFDFQPVPPGDYVILFGVRGGFSEAPGRIEDVYLGLESIDLDAGNNRPFVRPFVEIGFGSLLHSISSQAHRGGEALKEAPLFLQYEKAPIPFCVGRMTVTDPDGRFSFDHLRSGNYEIYVLETRERPRDIRSLRGLSRATLAVNPNGSVDPIVHFAPPAGRE
jgi:RNA polymerase sigma-70 factor (ECF subfamily)